MAHPDAFCGRMRFYLNMRIGKGQKKRLSRFLVEFVLLCRAIAQIVKNVFPSGKTEEFRKNQWSSLFGFFAGNPILKGMNYK